MTFRYITQKAYISHIPLQEIQVQVDPHQGTPTQKPQLPPTQILICGIIESVGFEKLFSVESLSDMQELYSIFSGNNTIQISWYTANKNTIQVLRH